MLALIALPPKVNYRDGLIYCPGGLMHDNAWNLIHWQDQSSEGTTFDVNALLLTFCSMGPDSTLGL